MVPVLCQHLLESEYSVLPKAPLAVQASASTVFVCLTARSWGTQMLMFILKLFLYLVALKNLWNLNIKTRSKTRVMIQNHARKIRKYQTYNCVPKQIFRS